jgi:hypothetical protein
METVRNFEVISGKYNYNPYCCKLCTEMYTLCLKIQSKFSKVSTRYDFSIECLISYFIVCMVCQYF